MTIHPTAIIENGAELHESVSVGPYSIIEAGTLVGENCIIESHVRIYQGTRLGKNNRICHGVVLGCEPQDLGFSPEKSKPLTIGDSNHFKESVNISRGVKTEAGTQIGSHNYLMTHAHIGHDCIVGDHNIFANTAMLAGHVELAHHVFLSGHTAVHQFCHIGAYVMLGGISGVTQDIPPYVLADGHRAEVIGLNQVGLRRNGFTQQQRSRIKQAYRTLYRSGLSLKDAVERLSTEDPTPEIINIVKFIEHSNRGLISHR